MNVDPNVRPVAADGIGLPARPLRTAVVVYDGDCGFCTAFVAAAGRRLGVPVTAVPWQSAALDQLGVPAEDAMRAVQWVAPDGARQQGHEAVAAWLRAAPGPGWRLLGAAIGARPTRPIAAGVYRLVATNRGRIPGPWARTCTVPGSRADP